MKKIFRLQAYTKENRYSAIENIEQVIHSYSGFLMDYRMYSDLQISLYIEMKEYRLLNFYHRLKKVVKLTNLDLNDYDPHSMETCRIYLNVNFGKGVGNLAVKIPEVPG